jgi:hypothetical protein
VSGAADGTVATTLIIDDAPVRVPTLPGRAGLWVSPADAEGLTGWEVTAEGACHGARCVPLPPDAIDGDGAIDLAGLARQLGQPVLHDQIHDVWLIGDEPGRLRDRLRSLDAPDFTLADLAGRPRSLRQCRGRKVLLLVWASW